MTDSPAPTGAIRRLGGLVYDTAPLLLVLTILFWSGNFIVGRAVHAEVPPVGLAFWRWFGGFLILLPFAAGPLRRDAGRLRQNWKMLVLLGVFGVACFNTFVYIGLGRTDALNALLLQSAMPVLIVGFSFLLFRERIGRWQALGLALSIVGVFTIATHGRLELLARLTLNPGDAWIVLAVTCYAFYSAMLRRRPAGLHPLSFLAATFLIGAAVLLPFHLWEIADGRPMHLDRPTLLAVAYVAVFPSILAYMFFNRGVELVGANRAGQYIHLMPVFGSVLAMVFLGERPQAYHAAGIVLIVAGIVAATRGRPRQR